MPKAMQKYFRENFNGTEIAKFSPANLSPVHGMCGQNVHLFQHQAITLD